MDTERARLKSPLEGVSPTVHLREQRLPVHAGGRSAAGSSGAILIAGAAMLWRYRTGMRLMLLAGGAFLLLLYAYSRIMLIDDAYIFLRYAHNIARGYGYVFNAGEPVEGTTSISWTLILAALDWLGLPLELAAEALSFGLALAILACVWLKCYRDRYSLAATAVALAALVLAQSWRLSIMMGLETGLYGLLLLCLPIALLWRAGAPHGPAAALIGALLLLTRPEAILTLGVAALWLLASHARGRRSFFTAKNAKNVKVQGLIAFSHPSRSLRDWMRLEYLNGAPDIIAVWLLALVLISGWRLLTFGELLPNSVIAKSLPPHSYVDPEVIWPRLRAGAQYVAAWAGSLWPALALALLGLLVTFRQSPARALLFVGLLAPTVGVAVLNAGDWMPFSRLLTPLMPLLALLCAAAVQALYAVRLLSRVGRVAVSAGAIGASALACWIAISAHDTRQPFEQPIGRFVACYTAIGEALAPRLAANSVIAPEGIGRISYVLPDTRIFDFFGLTEPYIARHGQLPSPDFTFGKMEYGYTVAQHPDLFIFHTNFHFEPLNAAGYARSYRSFRIVGLPCEMSVGIAGESLDRFLPALKRAFTVEPLDSA